jgi:RimJ/RimL family protein N-acetyltransferase
MSGTREAARHRRNATFSPLPTEYPHVRSERLLLRPWRDDDLEPFAALNADPIVMEFFPSALSRAESDVKAGRIRAHFAREGFGLWALELTGGAATPAPFIGFTGLARPGFMPGVEIGWRIARPYWGAGYATEAARASIAWGFAHLDIAELVAMVVPDNLRSQRVIAKLGMRRDPTADFEHPRIPVGHWRRAHWLFRLPRP